MTTTYKIHPAIGIARVGNSPKEFYLAPEKLGALPIECDSQGNASTDGQEQEQTISSFKDSQGRVKRQAARFQILVYDDEHPEGKPLKVGDTIQGLGSEGKLVDIQWHVYIANKKAAWYEFKQLEGEHGYAPDHPLRNADIKEARQQLIIDPGPQTVNCTGQRSAEFAKGKNPGHTQIFPPPLSPDSIETLGEIMTDDSQRLIVLGGYGNSGSFKTGFGHPRITNYANNDGWFDDVADGPVTARLKYWDELDQEYRYLDVQDPSWVIVGYPRFAPQLVDMVTMDEVVYDLFVREFAYNTYLYGTGPFDEKQEVPPDELGTWRKAAKGWNPDYYPYFYKEIWPILMRPHSLQWVTNVLAISSYPHNTGHGGNFQMSKISVPPKDGKDPYRAMRQFIYEVLRKPGQENAFNDTSDPSKKWYGEPYMPLLCGDNPLSNTLPSKFLRMTDTQLFFLKQWAEGKFINEQDESIRDNQVEQPIDKGVNMDRGVLDNVLGGAFCPGGEVGWIMRNPAIYLKPYRIKHNPAYVPTSGATRASGLEAFSPPPLSLNDDLKEGLEPGDLTKHMSVPWQADFNECSNQDIDITYDGWNNLYLDSTGDPAKRVTNPTLWWPSHRPMQVYIKQGDSYPQVDWARGIPQSNAGDLKMVTEWKKLGFVLKNPDTDAFAQYIEVEAADNNG